MSQANRSHLRLPMILFCVVLMASFVIIVGQSFRKQDRLAEIVPDQIAAPLTSETPIRSESQVFRGLKQESRFVDQDIVHTRTLAKVYERRAYPGAPPTIPHAIDQDMKTAFDRCQGCHEQGGFVAQFQAYAPVTPHPEFSNCRQCHVAQITEDLFKETTWQRPQGPALGFAAMPGGPPPIPHSLQMRENCSACHAGPAAPPEIKTSHPERIYCRQCHVPSTNTTIFERLALENEE